MKSYEKRYFVLTRDKLYYYTNEKKKKIRGCINFLIAECEIDFKKKNQFDLNIISH